MTNNAIPNVPRELLERAAYTLELAYEVDTPTVRDIRALLSAPSPAGVDGLEVVAWRWKYQIPKELQGSAYGWSHASHWSTGPKDAEELCRLSDAQAIIDGLRGGVERLQMQLAACGVVALADQQAQRIGELEGLLRDARELITHGVFEDGICCCGSSVESHGFGDGHSPVDALAYFAGQVCERIDAALSAGKENQDEHN